MSKRSDADLRAESIEVRNSEGCGALWCAAAAKAARSGEGDAPPVPPAPTPPPTPFTRGERESECAEADAIAVQADARVAPRGESAASPVSEGLLEEGRRSAELKAAAMLRSTCCPVSDPR
jgi:hypothetical protein